MQHPGNVYSSKQLGAAAESLTERDVEVLVVGAGFSGVGAAIRLRQAGFENLLVLEKEEAPAGPGATTRIRVARSTCPRRCIPFLLRRTRGGPGSSPGSRRFMIIPAARPWTVTESREDPVQHDGLACAMGRGRPAVDGAYDQGLFAASFLVMSCGPWHQPFIPELPGLADFPGPVMHTAQWDHDVEISGKRVAIVGTGASAVQVIPELQLAGSGAAYLSAHPVLGAAEARRIRTCRGASPDEARARVATRCAILPGIDPGGSRIRANAPVPLGPVQAMARMHLRISVRDACALP